MTDFKNSRFGSFALATITILTMGPVGYKFTATNPLLPILQLTFNQSYTGRYGVSMSEQTWLLVLTIAVSFVIVGGLVGGTLGQFLLRIMSRKRLLQLNHILSITGVILMAVVAGITKSYEVFTAGRFILGCGFGISYIIVPILVAEISATNSAVRWQSVSAIAGAGGIFLAPLIGHPKALGNLTYWPVVFSLGALPCIAFLIISWWIPNTPYYLLREGREEDAFQALSKLRTGTKSDIMNEIESIRSGMKDVEVLGLKEILTTRQYRNQIMVVYSIYLHLKVAGINNVVIYSDLVFLEAGLSADVVTFASSGVFGLAFLSTFFGSKVIDRFGSYKMQIGSTVVIIFALALFTVSQATKHLAPTVMPFISIVAVALFTVAWSGGLNTAFFPILSELTIEETRPTMFGFGSVILWISSWLVAFLPPYLQLYLGPYALTIWLGCSIFFLIFQLIFMPNTKGKSSAEIQEFFKGK